MKVYRCSICGRIVEEIREGAGIPVCCGSEMTELKPGALDGAQEKHVPVVAMNGNSIKVTVGSVEHPMMEAHFIEWIAVETTRGIQRKQLSPSCRPCAEFCLAEGESFIAAYAYCNIHGLWKNS